MVATNQQFVATKAWPDAVAAETFGEFKAQLQKDSDGRSFMRRFWQLQCRGAKRSRRDVQALAASLGDIHCAPESLALTLQWLQDEHLPDVAALPMPVLHQFGCHDALVPVRAAQCARRRVAHRNAGRNYLVTVFGESSHLPFLSEREAWLQQTHVFLDDAFQTGLSQQIDKSAVARAFSKAAVNYDKHASFQFRQGEDLLALLPQRKAQRVLDLGAGTGKLSIALANLYPAADLVQLDLSSKMLDQCRQKTLHGSLVQADFDQLPFASGSFDLIFSNLALQWCFCIEQTLAALYRQLAPGGQLLVTTLTAGSMRELGEAWAGVDESEHISNFYGPTAWRNAIDEAGFHVEVWQAHSLTEHFAELSALLTSVRGIGASNANAGRPMGLTGKERYAQFVKNYEALRTEDGLLPLSYELLTAVVRRPAEED